MARFFFGNAVWGCLRLRDIPDRGLWDPARIAYWDETYLDGISRLALIGQKVRSAADLDESLAASRQAPGIRTLWIHEDLLDETKRRWEGAQEAVGAGPQRARVSVLAAAAAAAVLLLALMSIGRTPESPTPPPVPNRDAAQVTTAAPNTAAQRAVGSAVASYVSSLAAFQPVHRFRSTVAYAVSIGTFASAVAAERMKHLVGSKGYVVVVVPHGVVSQVVTPPYRTRAQAERVMRGLAESGLPARLTAWRVL